MNVIWIFGALFWTFWPPSWFEVQNAVEQVSVEFLDGDLALIAYSVENDTLMPGYLKVSGTGARMLPCMRLMLMH